MQHVDAMWKDANERGPGEKLTAEATRHLLKSTTQQNTSRVFVELTLLLLEVSWLNFERYWKVDASVVSIRNMKIEGEWWKRVYTDVKGLKVEKVLRHNILLRFWHFLHGNDQWCSQKGQKGRLRRKKWHESKIFQRIYCFCWKLRQFGIFQFRKGLICHPDTPPPIAWEWY